VGKKQVLKNFILWENFPFLLELFSEDKSLSAPFNDDQNSKLNSTLISRANILSTLKRQFAFSLN
jgi:hypothetical protein